MSDAKILISSRKCHVALGCMVAYFRYQGAKCPELCSKWDSKRDLWSICFKNSVTAHARDMVEGKDDLLLSADTIYRSLVVVKFLPVTKEERTITKCQGKWSFSYQPLHRPTALERGPQEPLGFGAGNPTTKNRWKHPNMQLEEILLKCKHWKISLS